MTNNKPTTTTAPTGTKVTTTTRTMATATRTTAATAQADQPGGGGKLRRHHHPLLARPNDGSVTGYRILRRRPPMGETTPLIYVADTHSTETTFTDTGVTAGIKHVYRVKAINTAGLSRWSNYVNPTT